MNINEDHIRYSAEPKSIDFKPFVLAQIDCQKRSCLKNTKGYGYDYADLEAIHGVINPALATYNLSLLDSWDHGDFFVTMVIGLEGEITSTKTSIRGIDVGGLLKGKTNYAQALGALETYLRRYNRIKLFNLHAIKDDDAASLTESNISKKNDPPVSLKHKPVVKKITPLKKAKIARLIQNSDEPEKVLRKVMSTLSITDLADVPESRFDAMVSWLESLDANS